MTELRAWVEGRLQEVWHSRWDEELHDHLGILLGTQSPEELAQIFLKQASAFAAWTKTCPVDEVFPLCQLCEGIERHPPSPGPVRSALVAQLAVGMFADWARVEVKEHMAPHPLRQDMARAWLLLERAPSTASPRGGKVTTPSVACPVFQKVLLDGELVNLALGSLVFDLDWFAACAVRPEVRALRVQRALQAATPCPTSEKLP